MGAQGGAAGVKKGRAGNLGVRAHGESRGNLGRALRLCGEDGAGSWARTVSGFGQRATLAGGTGGSGRTTRGAGDAGLLRDVDRRGRPGRWVLGWIRGKGSGLGFVWVRFGCGFVFPFLFLFLFYFSLKLNYLNSKENLNSNPYEIKQ